MSLMPVGRMCRNIVDRDRPGERPIIELDAIEAGDLGPRWPDLVDAPAGERLAAEPGDVLFGKLRPYLAKSALVTTPTFVSSEFLCLRSNPGIDPRWLRYLTSSTVWIDHAVASSYGSKMPRASWEAMASLKVEVPPLDEQRRIADFLDDQTTRIDQIIAMRRLEQHLLDEVLLTTLLDEVTGVRHLRRYPSGLSWAPDLPEEWPIASLRLVARMGTGHTPSRENAEYWKDLEIPWVSTADIHSDPYNVVPIMDTALHISRLGLLNSAAVLHPAGTVMLCRTASVGLATIVGVPAATSQRFVTWTPGPDLSGRYLLHVVRAMKPAWINLANGSIHGTVFFPDLVGVRIPLPPLPTQEAIADLLDERTRLSREVNKLIDQHLMELEERRRAVISAAIDGSLDVSTASARTFSGVAL